MYDNKPQFNTYSGAQIYLGKKTWRNVQGCTHTYLCKINEDCIGLWHHSTCIIKYFLDRQEITLYDSVTTKRRINRFSQVYVNHKKLKWYANGELLEAYDKPVIWIGA